MDKETVCRVLIVDNELDFAAQTAGKLNEIRPSLLNHLRLEIELTNNAYFAAERLQRCPAGQPTWDIVIADVYMPFPAKKQQPDVADRDAVLADYIGDDKVWPCWSYSYATPNPEEKIEHGGFVIAETVAARLSAGEQMSDLKMILMSNCLSGDDRQRLLAYQATRSAWLRYYDKADWQRDNLTAWPAKQLAPDVFQWALFFAISQRQAKDWGGSIYQGIPDVKAVYAHIPDVEAILGATISAEMENTIREAWRLGHEPAIETVLIRGEVGTGREIFAKLIHNLRMRSLRTEGELVGVDCSSIPPDAFEKELFDCVEESSGGTLFIDEVDKLTPPHQGRLYHLLKDKRMRSMDRMQTVEFTAKLAICTASGSDLEDLNLSRLFNDDLYYLLRDEQLHILPLRERSADAVSVAEIIALRDGKGLTLSKDAREWIANYQWPGNNKELRSVIRTAARRALSTELRADDLRRVLIGNPRGTGPLKPIERSPENNQPEAGDGDKYVFRKAGDIWDIVYEGRAFRLIDVNGLHYIACLLRNPGKEFSVVELIRILQPLPPIDSSAGIDLSSDDYSVIRDLGDLGPTIDSQARREFEAELHRLRDDREIQTLLNDTARVRELDEEILEIEKHLAKNIGLKGRRRTLGDPLERARRAVWNNYKRALSSISKYDKELALHLENTIKTGKFFKYNPEKPPAWKF